MDPKTAVCVPGRACLSLFFRDTSRWNTRKAQQTNQSVNSTKDSTTPEIAPFPRF